MRGTWLVVMLVIVSMSVSESSRIFVEVAQKTIPQEEGANDWKDTACSWCFYTPDPQTCVRACRATLPDWILLKEESNDWKDTACSWCAFTLSPRQCVRTCRRGIPELTLLKEETNDWKDTVHQLPPPTAAACRAVCAASPSSPRCSRCREMGYVQ